MLRTRTLLAASTAVLASLVTLTACGPDDTTTKTNPNASGSPSTGTGTATPTGGANGTPTPHTGAIPPLPAGVWIAAKDIPLDSAVHWAEPASVANTNGSPQLAVEQFCKAQITGDTDIRSFPAESAGQAKLGTAGAGQWQAQQTVIHLTGTNSIEMQGANNFSRAMQDAVRNCAKTAGATDVHEFGDGTVGAGWADSITIPQADGQTLTLHEYIGVPGGGAVSELALWTVTPKGGKPKVEWGAADPQVVDALVKADCNTYKDC
ncbi:hypothetical protein [Kitasatospora sp. LaBMicrA B282]|uniref:hypothetical protein n=1 Tax=Kitasatospora sp. LaBMicrA B282 TaxID=3420949 RepID=UPI003D106CD7